MNFLFKNQSIPCRVYNPFPAEYTLSLPDGLTTSFFVCTKYLLLAVPSPVNSPPFSILFSKTPFFVFLTRSFSFHFTL